MTQNEFRTKRRKLNQRRNIQHAWARVTLKSIGARRLAHEGNISASKRFVEECHALEANAS